MENKTVTDGKKIEEMKEFDRRVEEAVKALEDKKVGKSDDVPSLRLPGSFVMLTVDGEKDGKVREGGIGIKVGDKWNWHSYTDFKKIIDMCNVCKVQFNNQLEIERSRSTGVQDL